MDASSSDKRKRKYFLWGSILTWTLSIPLIIGIFHAFRGISEQKATGLGAVAGGVAEAYAMFGLILAFVLPVWAIVLLVKSFSGGHSARAVFSLLYICWSALTLAFAGLFVWFSLIYLPHRDLGPR
jgi:uncharacterized membrane protein